MFHPNPSDMAVPSEKIAADHVLSMAQQAARAIPPLWPLSSSVAVNPFLGQAGEGLGMAAARLARVAGAPLTMPRDWYRKKIITGEITDRDLLDAWKIGRAHV